MDLVAVAAVAENGVIGRDGDLPWRRIPADKRQYRARVAHDPVVLGRRTFEGMREDLPGSHQIVLSRNPDRSYPERSATVVSSVEEALTALENLDVRTAYVLGGGAIYELMLPHLSRMYISRIPGAYEGDVTFPEIDEKSWELVETRPGAGFTLEIWERRET